MTITYRPFVLLSLLSVLATPTPGAAQGTPKKAAAAAAVEAPARKLERRTLTIDDASVNTLPEVYVAGGSATVITFQVAISEGGAMTGVAQNLFVQVAQTDKTIILLPKADLKAPVPLNVSLVDGTVLTFELRSNAKRVDAQLDVLLNLKRRAATDSLAALKARVSQSQADLEACRATTGDAGARKIATLLLEQSAEETPQAFDRRRVSVMARENRMLVEGLWVYRMMGTTYVILNVENRDPERQWVLERATARLTTKGAQQDVPVKVHVTDTPAVGPESSGRVVLAFPTMTGGRQEVAITLEEKDGGRTVTLRGVEL